VDQEADAVFTFRAYEPNDIPFIHSSWENSYYQGLPYIEHLSRAVFRLHHRPVRERILNQPNVTIIVCTSKEDPNLILGWIAVETIPTRNNESSIIIHYVYVKEVFKKEGIATHLLNLVTKDSDLILCSHLTERARKIMKEKPSKYKKFVYFPHLI
jgi:predicted GNAT family acetyltransferase